MKKEIYEVIERFIFYGETIDINEKFYEDEQGDFARKDKNGYFRSQFLPKDIIENCPKYFRLVGEQKSFIGIRCVRGCGEAEAIIQLPLANPGATAEKLEAVLNNLLKSHNDE